MATKQTKPASTVEKKSATDPVIDLKPFWLPDGKIRFPVIPERPLEEPTTTSTEADVQRGRTIITMRAADYLDQVLKGWTRLAITDNGSYYPFDLNMPFRLPTRANPQANWKGDSPITEMGKLKATLVGNGFQTQRINLSGIFSSPAFHCIQTARYIVKGLDDPKLKINVEPGLYEWMAFQRWPPQFLTLDELRTADNGRSYPINEDYEPIMNNEALTQCLHESNAEYNARVLRVAKSISEQSGATDCILLVGHGSSIDAIPRQLQGLRAEDGVDNKALRRMEAMGNHYPICSLVAVKQTSDEAWRRIEDVQPPFIAVSGQNAIDDEFYYR